MTADYATEFAVDQVRIGMDPATQTPSAVIILDEEENAALTMEAHQAVAVGLRILNLAQEVLQAKPLKRPADVDQRLRALDD